MQLHCKDCSSRMLGIFCNMPEKDLELINNHKVSNHYKEGQYIFQEGNTSIGLFAIISGKVKLTKSGQEGNEVILRIYKEGDVVGYRSLLTKEPYSASAVAMVETTGCFIDGQIFEKLIVQNPDLALKMFSKIGRELSDSYNRIRDLSNTTVRQRLAELLLVLNKTYGVKQKDGILLNIYLTRAEMAAMINSTPESVMRTLSEFQHEGFISVSPKKIFIKDLTALVEDYNLA